MHTYRPALHDLAQRNLLRQAADSCATACLRALEPESWQRVLTAESAGCRGHAPGDHGTPSHCGGPKPSLQEPRLHQLLHRLVTRQKGLFHVLSTDADRSRSRPRIEGYELMAFLSEVFVPTACEEGFWALAADEVAGFLQSLSVVATREKRSLIIEYRYLTLLAIPALWSLIGAHPILAEAAPMRTSRAERLQRAWATCALFNALQQLRELPPSVKLVAGVLAALSSPASAAAWIESARQTAEARGAHVFVQFFARLAVNR